MTKHFFIMIKRPFIPLLYLILVFIFLMLSDVHGQTAEDAPKTLDTTEMDSLINTNHFKEGIVLVRKAISSIPKTDYINLANLYNKLSFCYLSTSKMTLAKENAEKALKLCALGGQGASEEEAKSYFRLGIYYDRMSASKQAESFFKKSLAIYSNNEIAENNDIGKLHLSIAQVFAKKNDFRSATVHLDSAYTFLKKAEPIDFFYIGNYHLLMANMTSREEFDKQEENYIKAIAMYSKLKNPSWDGIAYAHSNLASLYSSHWQDEKALKHLSKSQEIQIKEYGENYPLNAKNYQSYSNIYSTRGEYEKSLDYSERALTLYKNLYGEDHPRVGYSYSLIGATYAKMRKYEKALNTFKKAQIIYEKKFSEKHDYIFSSHVEQGTTHYHLGNFQESLKHLEKALEIGNILYGPDDPILIDIYRSFGYTQNSLNEIKKAQDAFDNALRIALKSFGVKSRDVNSIYNAMGNFYIENQQFDEALISYNKVITSYKEETKEFLKTGNHSVEFNILPGILVALQGKGKGFFLKYKKYGDLKDLVASNSSFIQSELFLEKMRANVTTPADRIELIANNQTARLGSVESFVQLEKHDKNQIYLEKAFLGSERNKAGTLQDQIYRSSILELDTVIKKTREFEATLKREKATLLSKLKTKRTSPDKDTTRLESYENKLFQIGTRYDSLLTVIEKEHPKYFDIEYADRSTTVQDVQGKLDDNTTLIEYFKGDSTLYAFVISKNAFGVTELSGSELTEDIKKFRTAVQNKNIRDFKKTSTELYQKLLAPLETELTGNKLIVVPDGPIWHLNFDLLLTEQNSSKNPKNLPYLLKDYAISYANSASYLFGFSGQKDKQLEECLAFSFSDSLNINVDESIRLNTLRDSKKDLPGSRLEISEIAKIIEGDYYYGSKASEANFKKNASNYGILHLAVHGEVNDEDPENSRLFFTKSKDSIEDGVLYAHELFAMNLPAELTVLSACSTGVGEIAPGEGMMSLGNAFQYAGSKSLLMTHWEVSDEVTPDIMKLFYTNLDKGMDKATALQQAKINFLEGADVFRSNPYYWGSFYMVGDTAPISLGSSNWTLYMLIGLLLILTLLYFFRRRFLANK